MPGPMIMPGYRPPPKATTWRQAVIDLLGNPVNEVMLNPWMAAGKAVKPPAVKSPQSLGELDTDTPEGVARAKESWQSFWQEFLKGDTKPTKKKPTTKKD